MPGLFHRTAGFALVAVAVAMFAVGSTPVTCSAELPAGLAVHLDAADADPDPAARLADRAALGRQFTQREEGARPAAIEIGDAPGRLRHSGQSGMIGQSRL